MTGRQKTEENLRRRKRLVREEPGQWQAGREGCGGGGAGKDGVRSQPLQPSGRHTAPDSPDVDDNAHGKEVLQSANPNALNVNDFHDSHRPAHQGELARCRHGGWGEPQSVAGRK